MIPQKGANVVCSRRLHLRGLSEWFRVPTELILTGERVEMSENENAASTEIAAEDPRAAIEWDDSNMATNFANVVNLQSTQEQVDLFFGTNQTWNIGNTRRVKVELNNRVIMSPHAAKRLWLTLGGVIQEYEGRHGELKID